MEFETVIKILGSLLMTSILFVIPILTTCAFVFHWHPVWQWLLVIDSMAEFITLCSYIMDLNDD